MIPRNRTKMFWRVGLRACGAGIDGAAARLAGLGRAVVRATCGVIARAWCPLASTPQNLRGLLGSSHILQLCGSFHSLQ
jgi:hypothetical protein